MPPPEEGGEGRDTGAGAGLKEGAAGRAGLAGRAGRAGCCGCLKGLNLLRMFEKNPPWAETELSPSPRHSTNTRPGLMASHVTASRESHNN